MKKIIAAVIMAIVALVPTTMNAQRGEKSVGVFGGFNSETESGLAGVYFQYGCNSWLRLSPNMQVVFRKHNLGAFQINGNAHFVLPLGEAVNVYGIGGVTYQSWRYSEKKDKREDNVTNRFGLAAGAGIELYCTKTLKLMAEGKYSFVKKHPSGDVFVGIGYVF